MPGDLLEELLRTWTVILGRSPRRAAWLLGISFATVFLARVIGGP